MNRFCRRKDNEIVEGAISTHTPMLFRSHEAHEEFFEQFQQLVDNYGPENITVYLPRAWAEQFALYDDFLKIDFTAEVTEIRAVAVSDSMTAVISAPLFETLVADDQSDGPSLMAA